MTDWNAVAFNLIDALLLGIPSAVVVPEVSRQYDIEIADLNRLYSLLQKEYNNISDQLSSNADVKSQLNAALSRMSPLGDWYNQIRDKYDKVNIQDSKLAQEARDVGQQIKQVADKLTNAQTEQARQSSLGGVASKWVEDQKK